MEKAKIFLKRIEKQIALYDKIYAVFAESNQAIVPLEGTPFLYETLALFGPSLSQEKACVDLASIYRASFHPSSGSLIVATRGSSFLAEAPFSKKQYIVCQIGAALYHPRVGMESVNIGIAGDIYAGEVIVRSESACPPSFLFNSQRCNCCYQWKSIQELAAHLNPVELPQIENGEAFERWIEEQFSVGDRCSPKKSGPGVLMIHCDSQSGMGSGFTADEFCYDLSSRALLRQLGENRVAQLHHTRIKEGFLALGLPADGRKEGEGGGYQLTAIIADFLEVSKSLICLSNNQQKLRFLIERGYRCTRVKSLGQVLKPGMREAQQRGADFAHLDIGQETISFEEEIERLKSFFCPTR